MAREALLDLRSHHRACLRCLVAEIGTFEWHTRRSVGAAMEIRDSSIPSVAGRPRGTVRALGTGAQPTAMQDLTAIAVALAGETSLRGGADRLQREAARVLKARDVLCFWIDWPHRVAWTLNGRVNHDLEEAVIEAAGSGKRGVLAGAVIEPVGPTPARAVLALRKRSGIAFTPSELTVISTLASSIAPALDRLIRRPTAP